MTLSFASRSAARKLAMIIGLVLIPALFFGGAFVKQALQDIKFIEREIRGVQLAELVFPAIESNSVKSVKDQLPQIEALEKSLGISGEESFLAHVKQRRGQDTATISDAHSHDEGQLYGYIADVASVSGVILDSDAESYYLANMLLITLPVVWGDAAGFEKMFLETTPRLSTRAKLAVIAGNLEGAFERQKDALRRAGESSAYPQKYSMLSLIDERLEENVEQLTAAVISPQSVLNHTQVYGLTSGMRRLSHAIVTPAFALLKDRLTARKQLLDRVLMFVLAAGGVASILAIFLATRMISTTFRQLDTVEEAHRVSELMREETERVNDEVANLNSSLSDNLKKLQDAQDELLSRSKMEQLGQLTATVAHEIRNPLGSVRTSAFLIAKKVDAKKAGIEVQIDRINKGVDRCDSIITQLLDFSRTKQILTQAARFDDWLETVVREEGEQIPREVAIECHLGLDDMAVSFDQSRLRRAIINLMNNAAEAMVGKGDKSNMAEGIKPTILIETRAQDDRALIIFKDNGPGMTAEVLAKVREPLFTTKNFGTGLGIPAVEQIVKQHDGELLISSVAGQGATFTISIPIFHSRSNAA
jgi:signal transduction histidine kinase